LGVVPVRLALALLPIAAAILAIGVGRRPAWQAGLLGLGLAAAATPALVGATTATATATLATGLAAGVQAAVPPVLVVLLGVAFYQALDDAGALAGLARTLVPGDRPAAATLALVCGVAPLLESATGFGVGVIVVAPMFLVLGQPPRRAAILAMLGQNSVVWGALANGTVVGARLAGLAPEQLAARCAALNLLPLLLLGGAALVVAGGRPLLVAGWRRLVLVAVVLAADLSLASRLLGPEVAALVAAPPALITAVWPLPPTAPGARSRLLSAVAPYLPLVVGVLAARALLPAPVQAYAAPAGLIIAVAAVRGRRASGRHLAPALARGWPAAAATGAFLVLAQLLEGSGALAVLTEALSAYGASYVWAVAPLAALGGYLTGSNLASNSLFMPLHVGNAARLGLDPLRIASIQNEVAATLTLASPVRIALGSAVVRLRGDEFSVTRVVLPAALAAATLAALVGLAL